MEIQNVLRMNSGVGELSYANNSSIQGVILCLTKEVREKAMELVYSSSWPKSLNMAELGCAPGPNGLLVPWEMINVIELKCDEVGRTVPEFQVFLNDLPFNDFNTTFRSPSFEEFRSGQRYVYAAPGNFYGRLFSANTLHFVHSSSSLHWLSQVPQELQTGSKNKEGAEVINKGNVFISKTSPPSVSEAYRRQFHNDFLLFIKCRSEELIEGGRMVLTFMGRPNNTDPSNIEICYMWELLSIALMRMASKGLIEEKKIDSFNASYYAPSPKELSHVIEEEGSFHITSIDVFEANWEYVNTMDTSVNHAHQMAKGIRAVIESMLKSHFGGGAFIEELFSIYTNLLEDYYSTNRAQVTNIVITMVKGHV